MDILAALLLVVCVGVNSTFGYVWMPGKEILFRFESPDLSDVLGIKNPHYNGIKLMAKARVQGFSDNSLRVRLEQPRFATINGEISVMEAQKNIDIGGYQGNVKGILRSGMVIRQFLEETVLVHLKRGLVKSFFVSQNEPAAVTNIKKSFLVQLQLGASGFLDVIKRQPVDLPLQIPSKIKEEKSLVYTYPNHVPIKHKSSPEVVQPMEIITNRTITESQALGFQYKIVRDGRICDGHIDSHKSLNEALASCDGISECTMVTVYTQDIIHGSYVDQPNNWTEYQTCEGPLANLTDLSHHKYSPKSFLKLGCNPYSQQACLGARELLGLKAGGNGFTFEGNYSTKGCYAYESGSFKGRLFYGVGGTQEQMEEPPMSPDTYRPPGYDCYGDKFAYAGCRWFGTSPFCAGECPRGFNEMVPFSYYGYGNGCWTGNKAFCCTK